LKIARPSTPSSGFSVRPSTNARPSTPRSGFSGQYLPLSVPLQQTSSSRLSSTKLAKPLLVSPSSPSTYQLSSSRNSKTSNPYTPLFVTPRNTSLSQLVSIDSSSTLPPLHDPLPSPRTVISPRHTNTYQQEHWDNGIRDDISDEAISNWNIPDNNSDQDMLDALSNGSDFGAPSQAIWPERQSSPSFLTGLTTILS
jgi:hypothetical protein